MRTARNQPEVEVMMDSVGIRISVRGMMPAIMARRVSSVTRRSTGPITKPMNRSMPVHSAPVMTWTKSRTQRLGERIAAIIAAKAAAAAAMYQGRSGGGLGRDDCGDSFAQSLGPRFRPRHDRRAVDRHRTVHGLRDRPCGPPRHAGH